MNQPRILVVEDEEYLRDLYKEILLEENYFVDTAENGNDGMEKIKKGGWDLILLDVILPGIDGIEIMRQMKRYPPQVPNKKVVFITNLDKDKEMGEALTLGDGYVIKSQVTPDVLMGKIRTYLEDVKLGTPAPTPPVAPSGTPAGPASPLPPAPETPVPSSADSVPSEDADGNEGPTPPPTAV